MQEIDGRQYPTVWSDLALEFVKGEMDNDNSISIADVPKWFQEYRNLASSYTYDQVEDLFSRGSGLYAYLETVSARLTVMFDENEVGFDVRMATIKSNYGDQAKTDAAMNRLILIEPEYQEMKNILGRIKGLMNYTTGMLKSMKIMLEHLKIRLNRESMVPKMPK